MECRSAWGPAGLRVRAAPGRWPMPPDPAAGACSGELGSASERSATRTISTATVPMRTRNALPAATLPRGCDCVPAAEPSALSPAWASPATSCPEPSASSSQRSSQRFSTERSSSSSSSSDSPSSMTVSPAAALAAPRAPSVGIGGSNLERGTNGEAATDAEEGAKALAEGEASPGGGKDDALVALGVMAALDRGAAAWRSRGRPSGPASCAAPCMNGEVGLLELGELRRGLSWPRTMGSNWPGWTGSREAKRCARRSALADDTLARVAAGSAKSHCGTALAAAPRPSARGARFSVQTRSSASSWARERRRVRRSRSIEP